MAYQGVPLFLVDVVRDSHDDKVAFEQRPDGRKG